MCFSPPYLDERGTKLLDEDPRSAQLFDEVAQRSAKGSSLFSYSNKWNGPEVIQGASKHGSGSAISTVAPVSFVKNTDPFFVDRPECYRSLMG